MAGNEKFWKKIQNSNTWLKLGIKWQSAKIENNPKNFIKKKCCHFCKFLRILLVQNLRSNKHFKKFEILGQWKKWKIEIMSNWKYRIFNSVILKIDKSNFEFTAIFFAKNVSQSIPSEFEKSIGLLINIVD